MTLMISGCCVTPSTTPIVHDFNNVQHLIQLPDAHIAKEEAPIFTRKALETIVELEFLLESSN